MMRIRIAIARWLLGHHCACYKMGYHPLCDFSKRKIGNTIK